MYNYRPNCGFSPYFSPPPNRKIHFNIEHNPTAYPNKQVKPVDNAMFEIFGLKIYFDDLLIICILLFLYQEGIQDEFLFLALILLLLS